jgi:dGTPase
LEDVVYTSIDLDLAEVRLSDGMLEHVERLRDFLFVHVYELPLVRQDFDRVHKIIWELFEAFMADDDLLAREMGHPVEEMERERQVCDFIAGMTDRYTLDLYHRLFLPRPWMKL